MYFIGGMFAETVSCLIYVPVDVIKERRQVQNNLKSYRYKSDLDAFFTILKHLLLCLRGVFMFITNQQLPHEGRSASAPGHRPRHPLRSRLTKPTMDSQDMALNSR
jgi:hypothetical protein